MKKALWIGGGLLLLAALAIAIPSILAAGRVSPEGPAWLGTLRTLRAAQMDFRANDRDGDGKNEFWRKDVAGLYTLQGKDGKPIALIEVSTSQAEKTPKAGYLYRAIRFADEPPLDVQRFAACAYPATPDAGKNMGVISHEGAIYVKAAVPGGVDVFPADPLKEGWRKLD
ncbi:MAG TPA: hypothetical protein VF950_16870 [Planctomycetota bacterium]